MTTRSSTGVPEAVRRLLANPPQLHVHPASRQPLSLAVNREAAIRIATLLRPGSSTLETGAGLSTVLFALLGCRHTAIAPDGALFERIRSYCERNGIDLRTVELVEAPSQDWLPTASLPSLDLVLIDGDHAFPAPFIDWYYTSRALAVGGHMAVDDTQILTGEILREFMRDDRCWDEGEDIGNLSLFRKLRERTEEDDWQRQAFLTSGRRITAPGAGNHNPVPRAWDCCEAGEFEEALALTEAPMTDPGSQYERHIVRGYALRSMGRLEDARGELRAALELSDAGVEAYRELGWLELAAGRAGEAVAQGRNALKRAVGAAEKAAAHDLTGYALMLDGDPEGAVREFDAAVAHAPDDLAIRDHRILANVRVAWRRCDAGDLDVALALTADAASDPRIEHDRLIVRAHALRRLQRWSDAESHIEKAALLVPDTRDVWLERACLALDRGEYEDALTRARETLARSTVGRERAVAHDVMGYALMLAGRHEEAVPEFDAAAGLAPEDATFRDHAILARVRVAWRRCDASDYAGALAHTTNPADDPVTEHDRLIVRAHALRRAGQLEEAEAHIERAAALVPDGADVQRERASLARARGQQEEAVARPTRSTALPVLGSAGNGASALSPDPRFEAARHAIETAVDAHMSAAMAEVNRTRRFDSRGAVEALERWLDEQTDDDFDVVDFLRAFIAAHPGDAVAPLTLARELDRRGDLAGATGAISHALAVNRYDLYADRLAGELFARAEGRSTDDVDEWLKGRFCDMPFTNLDVMPSGEAFVCCGDWLPVPIGNIHHQTAEELWQSDVAREVRNSIRDGSFRYCNRRSCKAIVNRSLPAAPEAIAPEPAPPPSRLVLSHDNSCNLSCPSCRQHVIMAKRDEQDRLDGLMDTVFLPLFEHADNVRISGSGDPFASRHYRKLLKSIDRERFPRLYISLHTNGQLFDERAWSELDLEGKIADVEISIDAASPPTYAIVRRGGTFERLLDNLEFIAELRRSGRVPRLVFSFIVQCDNYREMPDFVSLGEKFAADAIEFRMILNWGTCSIEEYRRRFIGDPSHPEHAEYLRVLENTRLHQPHVRLPGS